MPNHTRYTIVVEWSDADHLYIASTPELPGCVTHGTTRAEALAKCEGLVPEWLAIATERGWAIPPARTFDAHAYPRETLATAG